MSNKVVIFLFTLFISITVYAKEYTEAEESLVFSGRISKINSIAKLIRIKINFENSKYLSKNDRIEFWNESVPEKKCIGYLQGRSPEYLLVHIQKMNSCVSKVHFSVGSYLHLTSPDLENHLSTAKELVNILHRKKTAIFARKQRFKKEVDGYIEKVDLTNKRYEILRQKLELEWQKELSALEEDKSKSYLSLQQSDAMLNEIDYKLRQYRIRDQNMIEDRWSLDPKLYFKK